MIPRRHMWTRKLQWSEYHAKVVSNEIKVCTYSVTSLRKMAQAWKGVKHGTRAITLSSMR